MKTANACLIALLAFGAPTAGAGYEFERSGSTWIAVEGRNGSIKGVWQIVPDDGKFTGNATIYTSRGTVINFGVAGQTQGDEITLQRVRPSDGTACVYRGRIESGPKISGIAICNGQSSGWTLTPGPRQ